MATYKTLIGWAYEPPAHPGKWARFEPGDTMTYPGTAFPTALPLQWLLDKGVIEEQMT